MRGSRFTRRFGADERGVAAIEFALVGTLVTGALLNVAEVSRYAYLATEVAAASQAGAQAAIVTCSTTQTPVTTNCPAASAAIQTAIQGTSLGTHITLKGDLSEGWYCVSTSTGALSYESGPGSKPSSCSGGGSPALYLRVQTTYTYEPIFPGLTLAEAFPDTIVRTAWMRML